MKNVKTMYRKLTMMVVLGVLLAVMSCNNLLTPPKGNSTDRDSGSGNVSEDGKVLITIKLFTGSARTVMPEMDLLTWHITAKQGTDNIEATGTYPTYTLELPTTGPWTFTVKGTKENKELFTGTVTENVSNSTTSISIPLSPGSGMIDSGATGKLNLTIKPENVLTMTLRYRVDGGGWYTCTPMSELGPDQEMYWTPYSIEESNLSVGPHTLDLYFGEGSKFYFCTVAVNIWPGMTSDQWIKTNGEEYINDSGEFVITEEMVNEFVKTMGSVVFVDASVDANTPATGSIFAPVKTVSTAVDILRKANPGGNYSGTIMVSGATTITNEVQVKSGETLTVKGTGTGASITNDKGRVFNIASGGSLTLGENITLTGTVTNNNGGAVYVNGGNFIMEGNSIITGSSATGTTASGGAIYVASGTFTMSDTATIQDNRATTHGGGVHIFSGGTFTMNGGTIGGTIGGTAANTAENGGGVFVSGGTFNMNDGTISGNTVTQSGGGVFVNAGNFTMKGGTIGGSEAGSANSAQYGGGVHVFDGTFTVSGSSLTITGNTAHNVYLASGKTISIGADGLIGGTIGVTAGAITPGGVVQITDKDVTGADGIFTSDVDTYSIAEYNGAVYLSDAETVYVANSGTETFGAFTDAFTAVNGSGGTITLLKNIDSSNAVFGTGNTTPITFKGSSESISFILDLNGKTIDRGLSTPTTYGSVIKIEGGALTIKDSSATSPDGTDGTGTITGGNTSGSGGGIHITRYSIGDVPGSLILESGSISDNTADGSNGGGVYIDQKCSFTMKGGSIDGNTVKNSATSHGGGVFVGGIFTMENGIITNNSSEQGNGGGVNIGSNGTFTMSGGTISGNTATSNGGGVCVSGDGLGFSTFTMTGGTLSGNTATSGNGGGVYVGTGSFTLGSSSTESSPVVSGNTKTDSSPNNVYLYDNTLLLIAGKLKKSEESGNIGVSMSIIPGVFTSNWSSSGLPDSTFFFSDKEGYGITGEGGELKMAPQSEIP